MFANPLKITPLAWLLLSLLFAQLVEAGPEIQHWKTTQGARVYFVRTEGLPLLDIRIMFDAGSARDEKKFGLASLTSGLLDTGAGKWDADTIAKRLESVGAILGTGTNHDGAYLSLRTLTHPEKLAIALETARTILAHPRFDEQDFKREKARTLLAIKQKGEEPDEIAENAFMKALYGDHPYAHPVDGIRETVESLSRNDLIRFHQRTYTLSNGIVVLVGEITRDEAETIANQLMAELPVGEPMPALPEPVARTEALTTQIPFPSEQVHIYAGMLGMSINDPDYFPLYVGNHILGGSGLVSRIMEEVREKRGFAYSAHSYFYPLRMTGPFEIGLQTRHDQAEEALQVALKTVRDYIEKGPSEEELKSAKKNIIGGFVLRLDSNQKLAAQVAAIGFFNRPLDYLEHFTEQVENVTRRDIQRALKARLDVNQLQTILVGGGASEQTPTSDEQTPPDQSH